MGCLCSKSKIPSKASLPRSEKQRQHIPNKVKQLHDQLKTTLLNDYIAEDIGNKRNYNAWKMHFQTHTGLRTNPSRGLLLDFEEMEKSGVLSIGNYGALSGICREIDIRACQLIEETSKEIKQIFNEMKVQKFSIQNLAFDTDLQNSIGNVESEICGLICRLMDVLQNEKEEHVPRTIEEIKEIFQNESETLSGKVHQIGNKHALVFDDEFIKMFLTVMDYNGSVKVTKDKGINLFFEFTNEADYLEFTKDYEIDTLKTNIHESCANSYSKLGIDMEKATLSVETKTISGRSRASINRATGKAVLQILQMVRMQWINSDDFVQQSGCTNLVLAAYTTAQARLKLYSYLEKLNERVLYADTDSVIFVSRDGDWEPGLVDNLCEMTNEVTENHIEAFVTGGPQNYAFKLKHPDKGGNTTVCKVRGITISYKSLEDINYQTIKQMVTRETLNKVLLKMNIKYAEISKLLI